MHGIVQCFVEISKCLNKGSQKNTFVRKLFGQAEVQFRLIDSERRTIFGHVGVKQGN